MKSSLRRWNRHAVCWLIGIVFLAIVGLMLSEAVHRARMAGSRATDT